MTSSIFLALGAVASVVGTVSSVNAQRKVSAEQRRLTQLQTQRSRRQAIRQAQVTRQQAIASAQWAGSFQSSPASGGIGSLGSRLGGDLGFSTHASGISANIGRFSDQARNASSIATIGGNVFQSAQAQGGTFKGFFSDIRDNT